jgi:hypothetical protein
MLNEKESEMLEQWKIFLILKKQFKLIT